MSYSNASREFDHLPTAKYFNLMIQYKNIIKELSFDPQLEGLYLLPSYQSKFSFHGVCFVRSGSLAGRAVEFELEASSENIRVEFDNNRINNAHQSAKATANLRETLVTIVHLLNNQVEKVCEIRSKPLLQKFIDQFNSVDSSKISIN